MLNLLFSPNGRISSSQMITGGLILIVIGFIPTALMMLMDMTGGPVQILGYLTYLLAVPWIFLWMKRYRDGGQSPAMCLVAISVYIVLYLILAAILLGGDFVSMFSAGMEAGAEDPDAMEAAMQDALDIKSFALKGIIAGGLASLITLFGLNALIKPKRENTDTFA